jgi:hypothetical protein
MCHQQVFQKFAAVAVIDVGRDPAGARKLPGIVYQHDHLVEAHRPAEEQGILIGAGIVESGNHVRQAPVRQPVDDKPPGAAVIVLQNQNDRLPEQPVMQVARGHQEHAGRRFGTPGFTYQTGCRSAVGGVCADAAHTRKQQNNTQKNQQRGWCMAHGWHPGCRTRAWSAVSSIASAHAHRRAGMRAASDSGNGPARPPRPK